MDAWVLAASVSGSTKDRPVPVCGMSCRCVYIGVNCIAFQAAKGGVRKRPYGGTRSLGLKRRNVGESMPSTGLSVRWVAVIAKSKTISLHEYRTNKRLTQGAKVASCTVLDMGGLSFMVRGLVRERRGGIPPPVSNTGRGMPPYDDNIFFHTISYEQR